MRGRMLAAALLYAQAVAYIDAHPGEVDEYGPSAGGRNGFPPATRGGHGGGCGAGAGAAGQLLALRRRDRLTSLVFCSATRPAWGRWKSPQVAEVLPLLYLHGLSSSDFGPALEQFLGSAAGLSVATITRLTAQWQDDARRSTSVR